MGDVVGIVAVVGGVVIDAGIVWLLLRVRLLLLWLVWLSLYVLVLLLLLLCLRLVLS